MASEAARGRPLTAAAPFSYVEDDVRDGMLNFICVYLGSVVDGRGDLSLVC